MITEKQIKLMKGMWAMDKEEDGGEYQEINLEENIVLIRFIFGKYEIQYSGGKIAKAKKYGKELEEKTMFRDMHGDNAKDKEKGRFIIYK